MALERRYDIDWLRVVAIGLLLIYHIAIVFQPWAMFVGFIKSEEPLEALWTPMTMLNVWRIPLLFYVSGMGLYFAMRKRNWKQLILERTKRILLPFTFGIVAIAPLHMLIFQQHYNLPLGYYPHQGHLWFLGNIFVYVLLLLPLFYFLKKQENTKIKKVLSVIVSNPLAPLLISLFFIIEVVIVKPSMFALYAQTLHGFFHGLLAFFFGFLLVYSGEKFWETVLKWRWLYAGAALILYGFRIMSPGAEAAGYLMAIESNCWIFGIFGFGYRYLNQPSESLSYLSQAAYPVYIIHMFVLYAGAFFILPLKIPILLKFICIVAFTGLVCYLIYEFIIRKIGFLTPLFGMKQKSNQFSSFLKKLNTIRYLLIFIFTLCTLTAFAQKEAPASEETEVAHKYRVSFPYFVVTEPIGGDWNDRTSIQMVELHVKRNLDNKNIIGVKFATWRLFQPMGITWFDGLLDKIESGSEFYDGYLRETGIGLTYQRMLWKGLFASVEVMPLTSRIAAGCPLRAA